MPGKKSSSGNVCGSHAACKPCGWVWLVVGIILLLNAWMGWGWNLDGVSVLIVLVGLHFMCGHKCCGG
jgi:hypothetical protein